MADSKPLPKSELPPPREYWRLLEPDEVILTTDDSLNPFAMTWHRVLPCFVDILAGNYDRPVRRRVSPPPTCATCPYYGNTQQYSGDWCSRHETHMSPSDYCSRHPQAQEANRG